MDEKPFPIEDADTAPFWDAIRAGRLELQRCLAWGRLVFYPRALCPHCGSDALQWTPVGGRGRVYSFTVVYRTSAEFTAETPYVVALVDLDEGARLMTRITGATPAEVTVGMAVELAIEGDPPLPFFRPAQA